MDINKFKALCKMAVLNARMLEDKESIEVIDLYPDYDYLCQISYVAKESGFKFKIERRKNNGILKSDYAKSSRLHCSCCWMWLDVCRAVCQKAI